MKLRVVFILLVMGMLSRAALAANAESVRIHPSAAETATGTTAQFSVGKFTDLKCVFDLTAFSGTTPALTVFLQGSADGGVVYADLPARIQLTDANTSTTQGAQNQIEAGVSTRNTYTSANVTAVATVYTSYSEVPQFVRLKWIIGGTTPSLTFSFICTGRAP